VELPSVAFSIVELFGNVFILTRFDEYLLEETTALTENRLCGVCRASG
jgi:hypothetical protein